MVEEAAGTSMYESKRDETNKLIEKKDAKLNEMDAVSTVPLHIFRSTAYNADGVAIPTWMFDVYFASSCYQFYQLLLSD